MDNDYVYSTSEFHFFLVIQLLVIIPFLYLYI